jgi:hypothetical protein
MALDGSRHLIGPYDRSTSQPCQHEHVASQTEVVEEDMVVVLHARSPYRTGHAKTHQDKG